MRKEGSEPLDKNLGDAKTRLGALTRFAPLPWFAYDGQDARGWIVMDALGNTVAMFGPKVPTQLAAEFVAQVANALMAAPAAPERFAEGSK